MSRYEETTGPVPNPSQYFLEWNSELNSFSYWKKGDDQQEGKRMPYPLPLRFAALKFMNSIAGFDENRRQGIYSNEISDTRTEIIRVLYRDGTPLAQGFYSQIKEQVKNAGGYFTRSIYAITHKGVIIQVRIKGGQMLNFGAIEKFGKRWQDEWIEVADFEEKLDKEGKRYSLPLFQFWSSFTPKDMSDTDKAFKIVKNYFDSKAPIYQGGATAVSSVQSSVSMPGPAGGFTSFTEEDNDDLPF